MIDDTVPHDYQFYQNPLDKFRAWTSAKKSQQSQQRNITIFNMASSSSSKFERAFASNNDNSSDKSISEQK